VLLVALDEVIVGCQCWGLTTLMTRCGAARAAGDHYDAVVSVYMIVRHLSGFR